MKLTIEEMNTIIQMMDMATKTGGLQVAQAALPIVAKLQQMAQADQQNTVSEVTE